MSSVVLHEGRIYSTLMDWSKRTVVVSGKQIIHQEMDLALISPHRGFPFGEHEEGEEQWQKYLPKLKVFFQFNCFSVLH